MLIHTYENLRSKYGFNDGDMTPRGIEKVRAKVIELINSKLPKDCPVEAYAYDRPGMHNSYLIFYREKGTTGFQDEPEPDEVGDILWEAEEEEELVISLRISARRTS